MEVARSAEDGGAIAFSSPDLPGSRKARRGLRSGGTSPAMWVAAAGLVLVVVVPFTFVILQAIFPELGRGSLAAPFSALAPTLSDPALLRLALNTVGLGIAVAVFSSLIAVPLALFRAWFLVPGAVVWDALMLVPFMIPPYIATLGWIMTLQPRGYLQQLTGFNLAAFLFSVPGMAFVMSLNCFPVVYFAMTRTLAAVGARYADVGRVFGASPWQAFWRITLPLSLPGLAASLLLVFAMAIEEYGTPAALGHRIGFTVLVTEIELRVSDWPVDLSGASIIALVLVLLSFSAFLVQRRLLSARNFQTVSGKPQAIVKRPLGLLAVPVLALFALVAFIAAGAPLLAILATALSRTISGGLAPDNLTLQNFTNIWEDGAGALKALSLSLSLGVATALVTGLLGAIASYIVVKTKVRGRFVLDMLTVIPNALPGVVVAVGLILAWNQPWLPITPYNTSLILLLAYCCILLPQPVRYTTAAFHQIADNLEAAARVAGASSAVAFRRILLPLILPNLVASMLFVFAVATRELVASLLVAPVGVHTVASFIWRQFEQGSVGLGMAMAFVAIILTALIPFLVLSALRRFAMRQDVL
ncbi:MAG: iron ABC transporter permease [Mesorhizobium sp.]|nr:iron ABC transporter permease [Mesorhizobium sp.]